MGGNSTFPLNLSLFSVAGCAADDIDSFVAVVGGDDDDDGPLAYENWPLASEKTPYWGEDWNGGIFQLSCWHIPSLHTAPDVD